MQHPTKKLSVRHFFRSGLRRPGRFSELAAWDGERANRGQRRQLDTSAQLSGGSLMNFCSVAEMSQESLRGHPSKFLTAVPRVRAS